MMCPHCGKSIPDGADKCPHCGEATDFARRSHYRETDSPLKPEADSVNVTAVAREVENSLKKENEKLRRELDEAKSSSQRSMGLAVGALLLAALCLGMSLFTLMKCRDARNLAEENGTKLEEMESTEQALQEQLTEVKSALDSQSARLAELEAGMLTGEDMESWKKSTEKDILGQLNGYLDELKEIIGGVQEGWDLVSSLFGLEETERAEIPDTEKSTLDEVNDYLDKLKEIINGVQEGWDHVSSLFGSDGNGNSETTGNAQG